MSHLCFCVCGGVLRQRYCVSVSRFTLPGAAEAMLPDVASYHLTLVSRMVGHLQLNAANIGRSTWLFGQMLSVDPRVAQEAATKVIEHVKQIRQDPTPLCSMGITLTSKSIVPSRCPKRGGL